MYIARTQNMWSVRVRRYGKIALRFNVDMSWDNCIIVLHLKAKHKIGLLEYLFDIATGTESV